MSTFQSGISESELERTEVYETPLYLLSRDEDCENSFHSTADFVSIIFIVILIILLINTL